jgi:hypothetical protein
VNLQTTAVQSDVSAALLLLSRFELGTEEKARARELCSRVTDWERLIDLARRKFSLPFVYRHLIELFPEGIPGLDSSAIKAEFWPFAVRSLQVAGAQAVFHREIVEPLNVPHAYLKGPALAARYYGDLGVRFSRDIDVLISRSAYAEVVHRAIEGGYRLIGNAQSGRMATDPRDVRAILRYQQVAQVLSPDNVMIEIHRKVDKNQGLFDEDELLARSVEQSVQGVPVRTLPTDLLFIYVCYHSTRHTWSLLHWLADLDAMIRHPLFDRSGVLDLARRKGMAPLVEACMEFNDLTKHLPLEDDEPANEHGLALLRLCLKNLEGGMEVELALRDQQVELGLPFDWLLDPAVSRRVRAKRQLRRVMPRYQQYEGWPLPDGLQWLYLPTKPLFWLKWHLAGRKN